MGTGLPRGEAVSRCRRRVVCKFEGFIPVDSEIAKAAYPRENFDFSGVDVSDLVKAWDIETPKLRIREQMTRKRERTLPIRWFNV